MGKRLDRSPCACLSAAGATITELPGLPSSILQRSGNKQACEPVGTGLPGAGRVAQGKL